MTYEIAKETAKTNIIAKNNDPNAYVIPFECLELVKGCVGKTYKAKNGQTLKITDWIGQNFVFQKNNTNEHDVGPAIYFFMKIKPNLTEVK